MMKNTIKLLLSCLVISGMIFMNSCSDDDPEPTTGGGGSGQDTVKFAEDIKPIITSNCAPCHVSGGQETDYENYLNAANGIISILNRVKLGPSDDGFMPKNGNKLSQTQLDALSKWQSDGLAK